MKRILIYTLLLLFVLSCKEDPRPRPKAFLALEYPEAEYEKLEKDCPFIFKKNQLAEVGNSETGNECWFNLEYPFLDGTIFITYQPVKGNLDSLLTDAQKLPLQHTIKADAIEGAIYSNPFHKTYGMFYEVTGNAASQAQFYLTDSLQHFLTGSVYFNTRPNYDSIFPASEYLKKDIRYLMESVQWAPTEN